MKTLHDFKQNAGLIAIQEKAVDELIKIGFFELLQIRARPRIIGFGADLNIQATQAARSAGYFEALDDILNFKEKFLVEKIEPSSQVVPDYGGFEESVRKGHITREEANELKSKWNDTARRIS